jgi:hypothetical protein
MDSSFDLGVSRMSRNSVYGVVLPFEIAQKARVVDAIQGMSRSKLMRDLLEKYLKSQLVCQLIQAEPPIASLSTEDKQGNHKQR